MAFTAREVVMTFRGQNYLSSALRRVGRDVGALSRTTQLSQQRAALQVSAARARNSRAITQAEITSLTTGSRALGLEARRQQLNINEQRQVSRISTLYQQRLTTQANTIRNEQEILRLQEAQKDQKAFVGRGTRKMATSEALRAAQLQASVLAERMTQLTLAEDTELGVMDKHSVVVQKLAADYAAASARVAQLTEQDLAQAQAEGLLTEKLRQNAVAMQMLPWERFEQGARAVEHAGRVLQMFGLISTAVFGYAAEQAAKFATQTTLAATQVVDIGNKSVKNVQAVSRELNSALANMLASGQTTAKPEELTKGIYDIYSSISLPGGQKQRVQEGINLLKQYNQVLTANYGFVAFDDVVKAGNILINDFGYNVKNVGPALNTMQAAVRFGRMNMSEFISTLSQAAPAAKGAGINFNQMADAITFLSRKFPSIRFAATGYARLVEVLHRNSDEFKQFGINVDDAHGRLRPLDQIFAQIVRRFPGLKSGALDFGNVLKEITGSTGTFQARRAGIFFIQDVKGYHDIAQQVNRDNGELARSALAAGSSPGVAWAKFTNQLRGLVLLIGSGAIPAFAQLAKPIEGMIKAFDNLSPRTQRLIGYIGTFVSAGALLGGTIMAIAGGLGVLAAGFGKIIQFSRLSGEGGLLGRILGTGALAGETGSVTAIGALTLGIPAAIFILIRYHKQVMDVINALGGLHKVLLVVAMVAGVMISARAIRGLQTLTAETLIARDAVVALRLGLAALAAIGTIIVTVDIVKQLIDQYLPGLNEKPFSPANQTPGGYATAAAKSKLAIQNTKNAIRQATPQYRAAVRDAEKLFAEGLNPNQVATRLQHDRPTLAKKLAEGLAGPIQDALTLFKAYSKGRSNAKGTNDPTGTALVAQQAASVQDWIARVERARGKMLANPSDLKAAKNYENVQIQLNKHFKDQPALLAAINDVLSTYDSNLKKSTDSANTLGTTFQDVLSGVQGMYQNFKQTETSLFGDLFNGPFVNNPLTQNRLQWGSKLTGNDLLKDLHSQVSNFNHFHNRIDSLRRRGAPQELINQLMAAGDSVQNMQNLAALQSLNPQQLQEYFKTFNQGQRLIQQATMRDLNNQLKIYRRHGRDIALAIIAGIQDENVGVTNALTKMIHKMFPGLPVGATGAGGRPTHHPDKQPPPVVNVHPVIAHDNHDDNKPSISKKARQRHADLRTKNRASVPFGGPR